MKTLPEVETAKKLMIEAMKWSVMTWLREKKRVRRTADQANAALDRLSDQLRQRWPANIRAAYDTLTAQSAASKGNGPHRQKVLARDSGEAAIARKLRDADDQAYSARMAAEQTFDEADKRLSTSLARRGCAQAIESWELHEKAIAEAEKCAL